MRFFFRFSFGLTILLLTLFLSACALINNEPIMVGINDEQCPAITVKVGEPVTWRNESTTEHQVSSQLADGTILFDSGPLARGETFAFTFSEAGTFNYTCSADGTLAGTITVE
ncbi:MAG: hypothetical protein Fur0022_11170 [Anaerolineales bacterium]